MFIARQLPEVPASWDCDLRVGIWSVCGSLAVMFAGMFSATGWQKLANVHSDTLMDSPLVLQVMMVGGFCALLLSLFITLFAMPAWRTIKS